MRYAFIAEHRNRFGVRAMCRCLAVQPSGFYAWQKSPLSQRAREDARQTDLIRKAWNDSGKVYGYRKLHDDLLDHGETCCPNRVARLTRLASIRTQIAYKHRPGSYGGKPSLVIDNTLDRQFDVAAPDRAWVTDITYIRTLEGIQERAAARDLMLPSRGCAYLLGRPGDPIRQADLLIALGRELNVQVLALDIEDISSASMSLSDAQRFIGRVIEKTGQAPLFYTNFSTYRHISSEFGGDSAFAKCPLWIARFRGSHGMDSAKVWRTYMLWQFQSELNCTAGQSCFRRVGGTKSDMDVNIFRGTVEAFRAQFGGSR